MNFHPFNQCWRWDKMSSLKMKFDYEWSVIDDWIIQRSNRYYTFRQKQEYQSRHRGSENQS